MGALSSESSADSFTGFCQAMHGYPDIRQRALQRCSFSGCVGTLPRSRYGLMTNRTAITAPLWIMLGMAAIVAMLLTLVAVSISWGGMAPVAGKPLTIGALLVLPLIIAAKCEWTIAVSAVFAYFTYFVLSFAVMLVLMRKK